MADPKELDIEDTCGRLLFLWKELQRVQEENAKVRGGVVGLGADSIREERILSRRVVGMSREFQTVERKLASTILGANKMVIGYSRFATAIRQALEQDQLEVFLFEALSNSAQFTDYEGSMADHYWKYEDEKRKRIQRRFRLRSSESFLRD